MPGCTWALPPRFSPVNGASLPGHRADPLLQRRIALPNLGINNVHIRLRGGMNGPSQLRLKKAASRYRSPGGIVRLQCELACGMSTCPAEQNTHRQLRFYVQRQVNGAYDWTAAIDLAHNQSLRAYHLEPLATHEKLQLSSLIGINLHFGNAHLMLLQGWVWTRPDEALRRRHLQAVFAYDVHNRWALEAGLRSFRLRADYPFIGLRFNPEG